MWFFFSSLLWTLILIWTQHVREVRSVARVYTDDMHDAPVRWPTRADWTSGTGAEQRVNWFGYALSVSRSSRTSY